MLCWTPASEWERKRKVVKGRSSCGAKVPTLAFYRVHGLLRPAGVLPGVLRSMLGAGLLGNGNASDALGQDAGEELGEDFDMDEGEKRLSH